MYLSMKTIHERVPSNDPDASSVAPPSTHTHTVCDDTSGTPIQQQPEIRSVPEPSRSFPQHDGVQRWSRRPSDLCSSKHGSHTGEKERGRREMAQGENSSTCAFCVGSRNYGCIQCMGASLSIGARGRDLPLLQAREEGRRPREGAYISTPKIIILTIRVSISLLDRKSVV